MGMHCMGRGNMAFGSELVDVMNSYGCGLHRSSCAVPDNGMCLGCTWDRLFCHIY